MPGRCLERLEFMRALGEGLVRTAHAGGTLRAACETVPRTMVVLSLYNPGSPVPRGQRLGMAPLLPPAAPRG